MKEGTPTEGGMSRREFLKIAGGVFLGGVLPNTTEAARHVVEGSPFDPETVRAVLDIVAREMHYTLDPEMNPLPVIIPAESITDEEFDKLFGHPTNGKRINLFRPPNTIYLRQDSSTHNLAHELTHYIQYHESVRRGMSDSRDEEDDANRVQNLFRD